MFGRQFGAATSFSAGYNLVLSCVILLFINRPFVCVTYRKYVFEALRYKPEGRGFDS